MANTPSELSDTLVGTSSDDSISGLGGNDTINSRAGDDTIAGDAGNDRLRARAGNDSLYGGTGSDVLYGGSGNDLLYGGSGKDWLYGGTGSDLLEGGEGNDYLLGGRESDRLNGGDGSDTYAFRFTVVKTAGTTVTFGGFDPGDDKILSQGEFSSQYSNWLQSIGIDGSDADKSVGFKFEQNSSADALTFLEGATATGAVTEIVVQTGAKTATRYYEASVVVGTPTVEITASDGNDTIESFQKSSSSTDKIMLKGLSGLNAAQLDTLFDLTTSDVNADKALDSVLSWTGGSITVLGTSQWGSDVNGFFSSGQVTIA